MTAILWTYAPLGLAGLLMLVLAGALAVSARRARQQAEVVRGLRADIESLCAGAIGVDQRQNEVERQLRRLEDKLERLELRDPGERSYAQAIRMVHHGAGVGELVKTCGLVRAEAELIAMLHRVDKAS